jgi:hypothetical protein
VPAAIGRHAFPCFRYSCGNGSNKARCALSALKNKKSARAFALPATLDRAPLGGAEIIAEDMNVHRDLIVGEIRHALFVRAPRGSSTCYAT